MSSLNDFLYDESFWKWESLQPGSWLHGWQLSDKAVAFQVDWINKGHPKISDEAVEEFVKEAFERGYDYVFEREFIGGRAGTYVSYAPSSYEIGYIYDHPYSTQFGMASEYPFGHGFICKIGDQNVSEEHPVVVGFKHYSDSFRLIKHSRRVKHCECPLKSKKSIFIIADGLFLERRGRDGEVVKRIVDTNRVPNAGDTFLGLKWPDLSCTTTAEDKELEFVDYGIGLETTTIVRRSYSYSCSDPDTKTQKIVLCANPKITVGY